MSLARIALGSVAPVIVRAEAAEKRLEGGPLDEAALTDAAQEAARMVAPIDDLRATRAYRQQMTAVLVRRALRCLHEQLGGVHARAD